MAEKFTLLQIYHYLTGRKRIFKNTTTLHFSLTMPVGFPMERQNVTSRTTVVCHGTKVDACQWSNCDSPCSLWKKSGMSVSMEGNSPLLPNSISWNKFYLKKKHRYKPAPVCEIHHHNSEVKDKVCMQNCQRQKLALPCENWSGSRCS